MLRYSLFAGPFGYGRYKTAARLVAGNTLFIIILLYRKISLSSPYSIPLYPVRLSFLLFSLLSLPAALPCQCDFPMRRYSVIRSSSTAPLTGTRMERQPSQIEDDLSVPAVLRYRVGYSVQSPAVSLPFPHFPAVLFACKISPGKESRKASEGREKKNEV